jgi:hypothetical protein
VAGTREGNGHGKGRGNGRGIERMYGRSSLTSLTWHRTWKDEEKEESAGRLAQFCFGVEALFWILFWILVCVLRYGLRVMHIWFRWLEFCSHSFGYFVPLSCSIIEGTPAFLLKVCSKLSTVGTYLSMFSYQLFLISLRLFLNKKKQQLINSISIILVSFVVQMTIFPQNAP